jgi:hypothetical protein
MSINWMCFTADNEWMEADLVGDLYYFARRKSSQILTKKNSVALVCERTIPTERPPLVVEVNASFYGLRGVAWSAWQIP